jgi:carboxypeptidase Q
VRDSLRASRHLSVPAAVAQVNPILRGWVNYSKVGNSSQGDGGDDKMNNARAWAGLTVVIVLGQFHRSPSAQQQIDQAPIAAIKVEGLQRSEAPALFNTLTDVLGPRLTGSPAHVEAARWARDRFRSWGLANARLEPFAFGRGWSLEKLTVEMTAPRYMPLIGYAEAWSPPTSGTVSGTPIYVGESTAEEIDRLGRRVRGAIVLMHRPQAEFLRADRMQPSAGDGPVQTGNPPLPGPSSATPTAQMLPRLQANGAAVVIRPGAMEHGTVRVQGNRETPADAVPSVVLAAEHYNMLVRLVQTGAPVQVRVQVGARFHPGPDAYNVLAEIPGTDPALRDEVVFVGAHLDSWHTATGATDNADGVAATMEAMRILTTLKVRPRRTIRVALWGGEEQGLLGARAWVTQHLGDESARAGISVYLNDDPGTGATYGFYMEQNERAKAIFDNWLEPLRDLAVRRNVIEPIGSTDHVPFDEIGIPAFTAIKDFRNYDVRTRHTNADLADAVNVDDLKQSAVVMAVMAWHAAMRDERIPRKPR